MLAIAFVNPSELNKGFMKDAMGRIPCNVAIKRINLHRSKFISKCPHVSTVIVSIRVHQDVSFDAGIDVIIVVDVSLLILVTLIPISLMI